MKTKWILLASSTLFQLAMPASFAGEMTVANAESHICDLTFLDQSLEANPRVIQDTLDRILTVDYPLFFSGGFSRILIKNLYSYLVSHGQPHLNSEISFLENLTIYKGPYVAVYGYSSISINGTYTTPHELLEGLWPLIPSLRAAPNVIHDVAAQSWNEITSGDSIRNAVLFLDLFKTFTPETYSSFTEIVQQISAHPKWTEHTLRAIEELLLTADKWGPTLATFKYDGYPNLHFHYQENRKDRAKFVEQHLRTLNTIEAPHHARLGARPMPSLYDLTAIQKAILSGQYSGASNALQKFYLESQEQFIQSQAWDSLFQTWSAQLKRDEHPQKIKTIRATLDARALVDQELQRLIEVNKTLGQLQDSLKDHLKTVQDEHERVAESALLQRLLTFYAAVQSSLVEKSKAQTILEVTVLGLDRSAQDHAHAPDIRGQLRELHQILKLNPELLKLLKKGIFG